LKRIAIFVEGQSEIIFLRKLIPLILGYDKISYKCLKLQANKFSEIPYNYNTNVPTVDFNFLLINVQNDDLVLSAIKAREVNLFNRGYELILGIRDMYCKSYNDKSKGKIDDCVSELVKLRVHLETSKMSKPDKIFIHFSIMEFEAWILSMHTLFNKIDSALSCESIRLKLGLDLKKIDPQNEFYRPSNELKRILKLCEIDYDKSFSILERIFSRLAINDLDYVLTNNRCSSYIDFINCIKNHCN